MLTEKANSDYFDWLRENHYNYYLSAFGNNPASCNMALTVDWLDSVGIHITMLVDIRFSDGTPEFVGQVDYLDGKLVKAWSSTEYDDRHSAMLDAIEQANLIYNSK